MNSLLIFSLLLSFLINLSRADDPSYIKDIYIDNTIHSESPNGSKDHPYMSIHKAFQDLVEIRDYSEINVYIAPSKLAYIFTTGEFTFAEDAPDSIKIDAWVKDDNLPENIGTESRPTIEFGQVLMSFRDRELLSLSNLIIIGQEALLFVSNSELIVQNVLFKEPFGKKKPFISILNCFEIRFTNIIVDAKWYGELVSISDKASDQNRDIIFENWTLTSLTVESREQFIRSIISLKG